MEALKRTSTVPIKVEPTEKNVDGFFDLTNQSITIQAGMSEIQTVCAVIHEIAHQTPIQVTYFVVLLQKQIYFCYIT